MLNTVNEPRNAGDSCAIPVPTTAREFERWLTPQSELLSPGLYRLGIRALLTLKSMDQPAFAQSEVLQRESVKDLQAFAAAYAEWK